MIFISIYQYKIYIELIFGGLAKNGESYESTNFQTNDKNSKN
jgi:hypothetical protein